MRIEKYLDAVASQIIRETLEVEQPALLRGTQDASHGDYQINAAMPLAKKLEKPPREIAEPLAEAMTQHEAIASAEVAGPGFVNLRLDDVWVAARLQEMLTDRERDGVDVVDTAQKVVVDFSSPNIAKQMHVGHLRSTIIGDAIVRVLRYLGHEVIGDNHLGDWGTQFGLLIIGMRTWGNEDALADDPIGELERVYKLASAKAKEDDGFADTARAELKKLQDGDADNRVLWERFVAATRKDLDGTYERLGVQFDEWLGESAYHDRLPGVVQLLLDENLAREDDGAVCVFFNELGNAPKALRKQKEPFIVRKRDGAFLYSTSDIATIQYRKEKFDTQRAIYVVDKRQALHFKQLFAVAELLGLQMELEHVAFGTVLGADGRPLRTRDGTPITLSSLLDEAEERAAQKIRESDDVRVAEEDVDDVARAVGIGAVKYADLSQNRTSDYKFDWDKMISFVGNAGPYLQYQAARCQSILRNAEVELGASNGPIRLQQPQEKALGRELLRFSEVVHRAGEMLYPHFVAEHLYALARAFSAFHTAKECHVLNSEGATRASRLALVDLTTRQLRRGLGLLGIDVVERM